MGGLRNSCSGTPAALPPRRFPVAGCSSMPTPLHASTASLAWQMRSCCTLAQPLHSQGEGFTWVRNLFTEQPMVTDGKSCNAAQPCAAQPRTICPFVK